MNFCRHEWRDRGAESVCVACGRSVDRPTEPPDSPEVRLLKMKKRLWQAERQKMLARVRQR